MQTAVIITPVPLLDRAARAIAWALSRFSSVADAGAFYVRGGASFVDAWREPGASTLRLGRLELVVDFKGR